MKENENPSADVIQISSDQLDRAMTIQLIQRPRLMNGAPRSEEVSEKEIADAMLAARKEQP